MSDSDKPEDKAFDEREHILYDLFKARSRMSDYTSRLE